MKRGQEAEQAAALYLQSQGYRIIERNRRSRFGEIDLIAIKGKYLIFVEVKERKEGALVSGAESIDHRKKQRILATAQLFLAEGTYPGIQPRFDVLTFLRSGPTLRLEQHIENAF